MIYLDNCATTRVFDKTADVVRHFMLEGYYNSSAPYASALENDKVFTRCIETVAKSINADADEVYFTSGGTESDNTAIFGVAEKKRGRIIISATEHPAVYEAAMRVGGMGANVTVLPVDMDGRVSVRMLKDTVDDTCAIVSIMHVNNETGVVNPIKELAEIVHRKAPSCIFHSDGVQAHMRVECDVKQLGVDAYSMSGHKIHAPKGVGALYVSRESGIERLFYGGGQQAGFRSGTINLPGIAGYAHSCEMFMQNDYVKGISEIKDIFLNNLKNCVFNSEGAVTAPHIVSAGFAGIQASTLQNALEEAGVIVGKGSACSSGSARISRVLQSMKLPKAVAEGTIRIGIGALNTRQEALSACRIINETVNKLMRFKRR